MALVSVIIPVYNGARWIGQALRSAFAQTYRDFEVIVVDDGSTDDLDAALAEWTGRIIFERQANGGPGSARNRGLARANGRFVAFLDADDEWLPDKLALQVQYFERYPQTGLLHTALVGDTLGRAETGGDGMPPPENVFCGLFHTDFFIRTLTVMAPRAVVLEAGGFDERREIHVEDWDLWLRIAARHPIGYLPRRLALHRQGGHMSTAFEKTFAGQALVIEKHKDLCQVACARHRGKPGRCLRERRHVLQWSLGYERFHRGNTTGARQAFARALALRPWDLSTAIRWAACFVPKRWVAGARKVRRRAGWPAHSRQASAVPARSGERLTIAHDTLYRRSRRRVAKLVHSVDSGLTRALRRRRRILFEASSPMSFGQFQPVYERLKDDPRLELWFTAPGRAWDPETIFSSVGVTERVIPARRAAWRKWDLCINADFFEMTNLRRRTRRVHLFHGVAGKYALDAPVERAREIADLACLMFPNEDRLRRYVDAGLVSAEGGTAALVGYPKADALVDGRLDGRAIGAELRLDPERPTVLYAPTWSPHSSLQTMGEEIVERLAAEGFQVIVKLHDRSYDMTPRGSGGVDWARRLARYDDHPLVRVVRHADATPLLFVSDAMVTDHSSIGFEFLLLDRPLVIVDCPALLTHSETNPEKVAQLRAAADVVRTPAEVPAAVRAGLADPRRLSRARRATADAFFYGAGSATARAVRIVYGLLQLPEPQPVERCRPHELEVTRA
jgi:glycosyltransferase involved in cell wall biosynthesis